MVKVFSLLPSSIVSIPIVPYRQTFVNPPPYRGGLNLTFLLVFAWRDHRIEDHHQYEEQDRDAGEDTDCKNHTH